MNASDKLIRLIVSISDLACTDHIILVCVKNEGGDDQVLQKHTKLCKNGI